MGLTCMLLLANLNDINTEPAVNRGGQFSRVVTESNYSGSGDLNIVIATDNGGQASLSLSGLQKIRIPFGTHDVLVGENSAGIGQFALQPVASSFDDASQHASSNLSWNGLTSLNAGETYRFIYDPSLEAGDYIEFRLASDGTTVYNTGVTTFDGTSDGDPKDGEEYKGVTFAVPADAPPLQLWYYNSFASSFDNGAARSISISGSTYTVPITGITQEGPAANQTGSNLFDAPNSSTEWGWLSVDEQLSAGERLVLDNAFLVDLVNEMPNNSAVFIGLKSDTWTSSYRNNSIANATYAGARFAIYRYSASDVRVFGYITGAATIGRNTTVSGISTGNYQFAMDITSSGNNIRLMIGSDVNSGDNVNSTTYADWDSSYKTQTGDQGYGLSSLDVMVLGDGNVASSEADGEFDTANVDWTGLSEISVPAVAPTNDTSWTKALDFSGSSERAAQVTQDSNRIPMKMGGTSNQVSAPTAGQTVSSGHPWATACVFKVDGHGSNQHIWNLGEGAGSTDDNIYLRLSASRDLFFGWGRDGALNEIQVADISNSISGWHGVYIGFNGTRLSGSNATPANLAACFDIRYTRGNVNWTINTNSSTQALWTNGSSGGRMDREFNGYMTIGGRGSNRSFHGKVASFVTTTLRCGQTMPTDAEITEMITDPIGWLNDYKVGSSFRLPWQTGDSGFNFSLNDGSSSYSTQVWLMGDGIFDSYSNMIRNQVNPSDQNYGKLNLISMVSNDIQNVTISGLS